MCVKSVDGCITCDGIRISLVASCYVTSRSLGKALEIDLAVNMEVDGPEWKGIS